MRSAASEAVTYRKSNPIHLGAEGTGMFGVGGARSYPSIGALVPAACLPDTLGSGSMWGLPPRHTELVSHYG